MEQPARGLRLREGATVVVRTARGAGTHVVCDFRRADLIEKLAHGPAIPRRIQPSTAARTVRERQVLLTSLATASSCAIRYPAIPLSYNTRVVRRRHGALKVVLSRSTRAQRLPRRSDHAYGQMTAAARSPSS
jgi:hypothetical protein